MTFTDASKARVALRYWLIGKSFNKTLKAIDFAEAFHSGLRKDGITPEFHHQISILLYLRTLKDASALEDIMTVAALHDLFEDYNFDHSELERLVGPEIINLSLKMSKIQSGKKLNNAEYYDTLVHHPITALVKAADRANNLQTIYGVFTPEKQKAYIEESTEWVLPLIKTAKRKYPEYESAFENIKYLINNQIYLLKALNV